MRRLRRTTSSIIASLMGCEDINKDNFKAYHVVYDSIPHGMRGYKSVHAKLFSVLFQIASLMGCEDINRQQQTSTTRPFRIASLMGCEDINA